MWLSEADVEGMSVQASPKPPAPSFFTYCHFVSVQQSPLTVALRVSLPLPAPVFVVTAGGLPGLVRKVSAANSVAPVHVAPLYAL